MGEIIAASAGWGVDGEIEGGEERLLSLFLRCFVGKGVRDVFGIVFMHKDSIVAHLDLSLGTAACFPGRASCRGDWPVKIVERFRDPDCCPYVLRDECRESDDEDEVFYDSICRGFHFTSKKEVLRVYVKRKVEGLLIWV